MPVGTHGTVRGLHPGEVRRTGAQIILGNTYHLHLRPGEEVVRAMGGLHRFTTWHRPMLTDSGGFQVFSLEGLRTDRRGRGRVSESHRRQRSAPSPPNRRWRSSGPSAPTSRWRSTTWCPARRRMTWPRRGWSGRCGGWTGAGAAWRTVGRTGRTEDGIRTRLRPYRLAALRQTLWPIIQGGTHADLRLRSLEGTLDAGPVDRHRDRRPLGRRAEAGDAPRAGGARARPAAATCPVILWGSDFPTDLLEGIARGVDLFDCVAATRNGRHGSAWTAGGKVNIRGAALRTRPSRSIPSATARPARRFSRGYLRHLFVAEEMLGLRLVSIHNVRFLVRLGEQARAAILAGTFDRWSRDWLRRYHARGERVTAVLACHDGASRRPGGGSIRFCCSRSAAIGLVFYFLILRPQSVRRGRSTRSCSSQLKKGDEIITTGGIIGKVKDIKEDRVTIESGTVHPRRRARPHRPGRRQRRRRRARPA